MRNEKGMGVASGGNASAAMARRIAERLNPIDIHVGRQLRLRRTLLGLSQEGLGDTVGLSFQQVQKYERGINRISAGRLWELAEALDVPVQYFFRNMPVGALAAVDEVIVTGPPAERPAPVNENEPTLQREALELVRAYYAIGEKEPRRRLLQMAKAMAANEGGTATSSPAEEA